MITEWFSKLTYGGVAGRSYFFDFLVVLKVNCVFS